MAAILTTCPQTQTPVPTGQHATAVQFGAHEPPGGRFRCAACGQVHSWATDTAWLAMRSPVDA